MNRISHALAFAALLMSFAAGPAVAQDAGALRDKHAQLGEQLARNPFGRPVVLGSSEQGSTLRGDVHAVLDHPYAAVQAALSTPEAWCDVLVLPFNVKGCEAQGDGLRIYVGRKFDTSLRDAVRVDFRFAPVTKRDDYLEARLEAPTGPLGTHDYKIRFEAVPLDAQRTFVHLSYGYGYGTLSRIAMQTYLATSGAAKVGFSRGEGGAFVGGMRGVLERNTMRYFLAIDATLAASKLPQAQRAQRRMESWFRESERYPAQLHEMTREEYVALKRQDLEPPATRLASR